MKLSPTQQKVLDAMKSGKALYSNRLNNREFGCNWAQINTINALLNKGLIKAETEVKNGPIFRTFYYIEKQAQA